MIRSSLLLRLHPDTDEAEISCGDEFSPGVLLKISLDPPQLAYDLRTNYLGTGASTPEADHSGIR
jgi:hypothetical protein